MSKKIILILFVLLLVGLIFGWRQITSSDLEDMQNNPQPSPAQMKGAEIVSTTPDPLNGTVISATEVIEITFNYPLQNVGEFKFRIEPEIDVVIELSSDRKTAEITPRKPYELGSAYTIFIGPDTKFDGAPNLGEGVTYHFQTIRFRGI